MPMICQTSTSHMLSFKVVLISSGVLSAAILLAITDFAVDVPSIYNGLVSWLRPPYLYLVINCIIITIVASSKLQSTKDDVSTMGIEVPPHAQPVKSTQTDCPTTTTEYKYNNGVLLDDSSSYQAKVEKGLEFDTYHEHAADARGESTENERFINVIAADGGAVFEEDAMSNKENQHVMAAKPTWTNNDLTGYSPSDVKPPFSARFSHRRNVKASPEGGRTVLGVVSKPKRQDTLESTWKTITEGRPIPISRHLRKSDTWERDSHQQQQQQEKTMKKAETFNDRSTNTPGRGGAGNLRKEPSLSQDELNRKVEAFIKKFNEEMRLQRQESLNQYMEMINRGSH